MSHVVLCAEADVISVVHGEAGGAILAGEAVARVGVGYRRCGGINKRINNQGGHSHIHEGGAFEYSSLGRRAEEPISEPFQFSAQPYKADKDIKTVSTNGPIVPPMPDNVWPFFPGLRCRKLV